MNNLKDVSKKVLDVLREEPEARNSDNVLYFNICKKYNPAVLGMIFGTVLLNQNELDIPKFDSVGRARRKIVENHPELAGVESVQGGRWSNEQMFKEYAREFDE